MKSLQFTASLVVMLALFVGIIAFSHLLETLTMVQYLAAVLILPVAIVLLFESVRMRATIDRLFTVTTALFGFIVTLVTIGVLSFTIVFLFATIALCLMTLIVLNKPTRRRMRAQRKPAPERTDGSQKVANVKVRKDPGYLYYVDSEGDVSRTKMARGNGTQDTSKPGAKQTKNAAKPSAQTRKKQSSAKTSPAKRAAKRSPSKRSGIVPTSKKPAARKSARAKRT